ncbi:anch_rpt_wall multi-domain protein [Actinoplanes utahensis]|uniref:Anch_rpt_wall multi-domain protein n=2 Tax=Actinoplanes utahensis TaxID=1869 RepID=A0A0A6XCW2_ACTUT|nr:anch_rpt_wall multi-domain protein [Actinoplanes utahensis]
MPYTTARRARRRVIVASGLLAGALVITPASPAAAYDPAAGREVLGAGRHVDAIYAEVTGGKLDIRTRTPKGVVEGDRVVLHIPETGTSHTKLPKGYEFLGPEGAEAWVSTEVQDPSVVWPGWSFEGVKPGVLKGTLKIKYDSFRYAGPAAAPKFAVTQPGGFDGTKVSKLFVPGTTFTTVSGEPGSHTHGTWTFTAPGVYDIDFTVTATLATDVPISDSTTVRFVVGELGPTAAEPTPRADPPATAGLDDLTIVPNKVDAEYFVGQTITLSALSPDAAPTDTYRWQVTSPGAATPVADPKQTTATWTTKPNRAVDGTSIRVERLSAAGQVVETSEPQILRTRAKAPTTTLTVSADKSTYAVGDTATLRSAQSPQTEDEHYHWYLRKPGEDSYQWIPESRLADQQLPITADLNGAEVTARLFNTDHSVLAESAPIRLTMTGAGATDPAATIKITSAATTFAAGERATFTAEPSTPGSAVEWSVRKNGENPYVVFEGTPTLDESWDGAEIRAVVRDAQGGVLTETTIPVVDVTSAAAASSGDSSGSMLRYVVAGVVLLVLITGAVVVVVRRRRAHGAS